MVSPACAIELAPLKLEQSAPPPESAIGDALRVQLLSLPVVDTQMFALESLPAFVVGVVDCLVVVD